MKMADRNALMRAMLAVERQRNAQQRGMPGRADVNRLMMDTGIDGDAELTAWEPTIGQQIEAGLYDTLSPYIPEQTARALAGLGDNFIVRGAERLPETLASGVEATYDTARLPITAAENIGTAFADPTGENIANAALTTAAVPIIAGTGGGGTPMISAARAQMLKKMGYGGGGLGLGAGLGVAIADDAEASDRRKKQSAKPAAAPQSDPYAAIEAEVAKDPALSAKFAAYRDLMKKSNEDVLSAPTVEAGNATRAMYGEQAQKLLTEITDELARRNPPRETFRQAHPELSAWWNAAQFGAPMLFGGALATKQAMGKRLEMAPWKRSLDRADKYLHGTVLRSPNPGKAADNINRAREFRETYKAPSKMEKLVPVTGGALLGAEMGAFPTQYNSANAPYDSPEYQNATVEEAMRKAGMGAVLGGLGGFTGSKIAPSSPKPPIARTQALERRLSDAYHDDVAYVAGSMRSDMEMRQALDAMRRRQRRDVPDDPLEGDTASRQNRRNSGSNGQSGNGTNPRSSMNRSEKDAILALYQGNPGLSPADVVKAIPALTGKEAKVQAYLAEVDKAIAATGKRDRAKAFDTVRTIRKSALAVPAAVAASSFDDALSSFQQALIDLDGDGVPDAVAPDNLLLGNRY